MKPVGFIFALISPLQELCTATAVHHRLAQGWANAHNTKVGQLLLFLSDGSDRPAITCDRPIIHIFRTLVWTFVVAQGRDGGTSYSRYLLHWYPTTVCCNKHCVSGFGCAVLASDNQFFTLYVMLRALVRILIQVFFTILNGDFFLSFSFSFKGFGFRV